MKFGNASDGRLSCKTEIIQYTHDLLPFSLLHLRLVFSLPSLLTPLSNALQTPRFVIPLRYLLSLRYALRTFLELAIPSTVPRYCQCNDLIHYYFLRLLRSNSCRCAVDTSLGYLLAVKCFGYSPSRHNEQHSQTPNSQPQFRSSDCVQPQKQSGGS